MHDIPNYTLEEFLKYLGLDPSIGPWAKNTAKEILPSSTEELDWIYVRADVRKRESGCPELVISIPFEIKGL